MEALTTEMTVDKTIAAWFSSARDRDGGLASRLLAAAQMEKQAQSNLHHKLLLTLRINFSNLFKIVCLSSINNNDVIII